MTAPIKELLRTGAPQPQVALLPDERFFVRCVPVDTAEGAPPIASQVALALETLSPFPVAQLLHGHYHAPGSASVLVFAAYRRRFDADEIASWSPLDWAAPRFCALLGLRPAARTLFVYGDATSLTCVRWNEAAQPDLVISKSLTPEGDEAVRARVHAELLAEAGGSDLSVVELAAPPQVGEVLTEGELRFLCGEQNSLLAMESCRAMDVRPPEALASHERARRRDQNLWRVTLALVALLGLLGLGELGLFGARFAHKSNQRLAGEQRPVVARVMTSHQLSSRIDELSTRRLLPFEMLSLVSERKPSSIQFLSSTTTGLYSMRIEAQTNSSSDISPFQKLLADNPVFASVEVQEPRARDRMTTFTLVVGFKPELLTPAAP